MVDLTAIMGHRIQTLERQEARKAAHVEEPLSEHFRVAVSCPPDTQIHVRGGNIWEGNYWWTVGLGYYLEGFSIDFSDASSITNYDGNFANADYFMGVIIGRAFYGLCDYLCVGADTEHATAALAEAHIETVALATENVWRGDTNDGNLPLIGLVLRNDGRTGVDGAVLPIDRVNRGRSYYWKDLRPRYYTMYTLDG